MHLICFQCANYAFIALSTCDLRFLKLLIRIPRITPSYLYFFLLPKLNLTFKIKRASLPPAESGPVEQLWPHHMLGSSLL